jgi:hypothetical protein
LPNPGDMNVAPSGMSATAASKLEKILFFMEKSPIVEST